MKYAIIKEKMIHYNDFRDQRDCFSKKFDTFTPITLEEFSSLIGKQVGPFKLIRYEEMELNVTASSKPGNES